MRLHLLGMLAVPAMLGAQENPLAGFEIPYPGPVGPIASAELLVLPDQDGDELPDIGALTHGGESPETARTSLHVFGALTGTLLQTITWDQQGEDDAWMERAATIEDLDGDGLPEILMVMRRSSLNQQIQLLRLTTADASSEVLAFSDSGATIGDSGPLLTWDDNGDGVQDVLFVQDNTAGSATSPEVNLLSGADGAVLRSYPAPAAPPGGQLLASAVDDLNGDGTPDLLVGYLQQLDPAPVLYSGADGRLIAALEAVPLPQGCHRPRVQEAVATGDMNADGQRDLLLPFLSDCESTHSLLLAYDGSNGAFLRSVAPYDSSTHLSPLRGSAPDYNGDGTPEVILRTVKPVDLTGSWPIFFLPGWLSDGVAIRDGRTLAPISESTGLFTDCSTLIRDMTGDGWPEMVTLNARLLVHGSDDHYLGQVLPMAPPVLARPNPAEGPVAVAQRVPGRGASQAGPPRVERAAPLPFGYFSTGSPVYLLSAEFSGPHAADFSLADPQLPRLLPREQICLYPQCSSPWQYAHNMVRFDPSGPGTRKATLRLELAHPEVPVLEFELRGEAQLPQAMERPLYLQNGGSIGAVDLADGRQQIVRSLQRGRENLRVGPGLFVSESGAALRNGLERIDVLTGDATVPYAFADAPDEPVPGLDLRPSGDLSAPTRTADGGTIAWAVLLLDDSNPQQYRYRIALKQLNAANPQAQTRQWTHVSPASFPLPDTAIQPRRRPYFGVAHVAPNGRFFYVDHLAGVFATDDGPTTDVLTLLSANETAAMGFPEPSDLLLDPERNRLLISGYDDVQPNRRIVALDLETLTLSTFFDPAVNEAPLQWPGQMEWDPATGNILVHDGSEGRLVALNPETGNGEAVLELDASFTSAITAANDMFFGPPFTPDHHVPLDWWVVE